MEDNVSKIKERLGVVEVISDYIKLQKSGFNFKARCPFHNEKTPSFHISPERQIWHCFGCSKGGDIFEFIQEIEGVDFKDALRLLAAKAGIELGSFSKENHKSTDDKQQLLEICEIASRFFEKQLWNSNIGLKALQYLRDRGLADESIKNFRLGYAPDRPDTLQNFLIKLGYSAKDSVDSGIIGKSEHGSFYDRFRARIMFPICDITGKIIGFSARIFEEGLLDHKTDFQPAKYINTPQTAIYDKSRVLYGLDKARLAIRKQERCLVVEGNLDVIMSHQAGVIHTVASSGTALTDQHLGILRRYTDMIDLCFDSDSAGDIATERGRDLSLFRVFKLNILTIKDTDIKDAADYVKKYGSKWADYVSQNTKPFMEIYIDNLVKKYDIDTELGKEMIFKNILPLIKSLDSNIVQAYWLKEVSNKTRTDEKMLLEDLKHVTPQVSPQAFASPYESTDKSSQNLDPLEENIISIIIREPSLRSRIGPYNDLFSQQSQDIIKTISESDQKEDSPQLKDKMAGLLSFEFAYLKSQELWKEFKYEELENELLDALNILKKRHISKNLTQLEFLIKEAERNQDKDKLNQLVSSFNNIMVEINRFNILNNHAEIKTKN